MLTKHRTAVLSLFMVSVLGIGAAQARQATEDAAECNECALTEQFRADERVGGHGALETHGFVWSRVRR
jgi:hypothetical protein